MHYFKLHKTLLNNCILQGYGHLWQLSMCAYTPPVPPTPKVQIEAVAVSFSLSLSLVSLFFLRHSLSRLLGMLLTTCLFCFSMVTNYAR